MAGAGYKAFADGDVLTAAQVQTYLMDQAVMKFADSSARTSAIGTAVLSEGMVSYLADTDVVEVYDGSAWTAVGSDPNPGIGSNIVQATKTDTQTISSATFVDITGLSATITPSSATSKVLIIARVNYAVSGTERAAFSLLRGATEVFIGDAAGSRGRATHAGMNPSSSDDLKDATMVYLDSPASAAATTYKVQGARSSNNLWINKNGTDSNSTTWWRGTSSLLVVEVAA